jgi:hypothetical protein
MKRVSVPGSTGFIPLGVKGAEMLIVRISDLKSAIALCDDDSK